MFDTDIDQKSNDDEKPGKELDNISNFSENVVDVLNRPKTSTSVRNLANTPDKINRTMLLDDKNSEIDIMSEKNYQEIDSKPKTLEVEIEDKKTVILENKYQRIPYIYKVIEVANHGKKPLVLSPREELSKDNRFRNSKSFKNPTRPKTSTGVFTRNFSMNPKPPRPETAAGSRNDNNSEPYTLVDFQRELQKLSETRPNSQQSLFADKFSQNLNLQSSFEPTDEQQGLFVKKVVPQPTERYDVRIVEGHWKDQLINRG